MFDFDLLSEVANSQLYVMEHDGSNRYQLTTGLERADNPVWSPDGKWLAYDVRLPAVPADSTRTYLLEFQPGETATPRFIARGRKPVWLDAKNLVVIRQNTTWRIGLDGTEAGRIYEDSTLAYPTANGDYFYFYDLRKGRVGHYVILAAEANAHRQEAAKRLPIPPSVFSAVVPSKGLLLHHRAPGRIWKVSLPDGMQTPLKGVFTDTRIGTITLSDDEKEAVYSVLRVSAKLVMLENVIK